MFVAMFRVCRSRNGRLGHFTRELDLYRGKVEELNESDDSGVFRFGQC